MELTKKYRILYRGNNLLMPLEEYSEGSTTYVGDGVDAFETDSLDEAEQFIIAKELKIFNSENIQE